MKSVVSSPALRVVYLITGGVPALLLAALCAAFLPSTFWAAHTQGVPNQLEAVFTTVLLVAAILGTLSGWFAFFAIGTRSKAGRTIHYLALFGGIFAVVFFLFTLPVITPVNFFLGAAPAVVGCCLIFHLARAAQQGAPSDPRKKRAVG